jgi:hypothetical protein
LDAAIMIGPPAAARLEPATYGLEVDPRSSTPYRLVASLLLKSGESSG